MTEIKNEIPLKRMSQYPFYIIHESPIVFLIKVMTLMILSDIAFFVLDILFDLTSLQGNIAPLLTVTEELFFFIMLFQFLILMYLFLEWMFHYYWFDEGILHRKKGILWVHHDEFILKEIEATNVSKTLLGRIFDYGSVSIISPNQKIFLRRIPRPENFAKIITFEKRKAEQSSTIR